MNNIAASEEILKNLDSPFTELFSLLKRYNCSSGLPTLSYSADELKIINHHINNAMRVLLQGLQGVGSLMSMSPEGGKVSEEANCLGFFISALSNLTEALNDLRLDTDYMLYHGVD